MQYFVCHIFKEEDEEGEDEKEDIEELSDERKNSSNDPSSVMNGINDYYLDLLYGKLRERAVCGEFCVLIGYPSGQDGAILPARDCPFRSRK